MKFCNLIFFFGEGVPAEADKMDFFMAKNIEISKPGPKQKLLDSSNYVFIEADLKSPVWKYFLRDKKHGAAKCKECDIILVSGQSTSTLMRHIKTHKIDLKSVDEAILPKIQTCSTS